MMAEGHPYDEVARAWQGMKTRRHTKHTERKAPEENDGKKRRGSGKVLLGEGEADRSDLSDFGRDSGS